MSELPNIGLASFSFAVSTENSQNQTTVGSTGNGVQGGSENNVSLQDLSTPQEAPSSGLSERNPGQAALEELARSDAVSEALGQVGTSVEADPNEPYRSALQEFIANKEPKIRNADHLISAIHEFHLLHPELQSQNQGSPLAQLGSRQD